MQKLCALIVVSTAALVLLGRITHARRIDCRRYPFAPLCRGVAAKRAGDGAISPLDNTYLAPSPGETRNSALYQEYRTDDNGDDLRKYPLHSTNSPHRTRQPGFERPEGSQLSLDDYVRMSLRMRQAEHEKEGGRAEGLPTIRIHRPKVQSTQDYLEALLQHLNSRRQ